MICRDCRNLHEGRPAGCPDCGCQHKGKVELKKPKLQPVKWGCRVCGWTYEMTDPGCECDTQRLEERYDIFEDEVEK